MRNLRKYKGNRRCSCKAKIGFLIYAMVAIRLIRIYNEYGEPIHIIGNPSLWMAVKHIMRYFKGTLDFKFCLKDKDIAFGGFCDAD